MRQVTGSPTQQQAIAETGAWLERVVIGLGLCPFAKAVQTKQQIRYRVSAATTPADLLQDLEQELRFLAATDPQQTDTTLLIHPFVLGEFLDYNDFLHDADDALSRLELEGELQIASFHPDYCFADATNDDPANFTNRSPYPMLHLLREASVARAVDGSADAARIYERNIASLRALAPSALARLIKG